MILLNEMINGWTVIGLLLVCLLVDRQWLKRGTVKIIKVSRCANDHGMIRFALVYRQNSIPDWSQVEYMLVDRKNPSTVISGKSRSLTFGDKGKGENAEFLMFRESLIKSGKWDLKIKISTTQTRMNPLYTLRPVVTTHIQHFIIK